MTNDHQSVQLASITRVTEFLFLVMRTFKEKACFRLRETKKSGENSSDNKDIIHFRSIQQEKKKEYGLLEWDQCGCKSQLCMQQWRILLSKRNVEMKQSNLGGWVLTKVGCCPLHPSLSDTGNSQLVKSHEFFSLSLARFFFFFSSLSDLSLSFLQGITTFVWIEKSSSYEKSWRTHS